MWEKFFKNFRKKYLDLEEIEEVYDPDLGGGGKTKKSGGNKRAEKIFKEKYGPTGGTRGENQKIAETNKFYINKKKKRPSPKK